MKNFLFTILLFLVLSITALGQRAESVRKRPIDPTLPKTPALYELRCRGGNSPGSRGPYALGFGKIAEKTTSSGDVIFTIALYSRGQHERAAGADNSGLIEGSCAWIDRPLNAKEFNRENGQVSILFDTPANAQLKQKLHGGSIDTTPTAAERYPDAQTIPEYMKAPNHYWSFFGVVKDGYFQSSYHRHWTKPPAPYDMKPHNMEILRKP